MGSPEEKARAVMFLTAPQKRALTADLPSESGLREHGRSRSMAQFALIRIDGEGRAHATWGAA